MLLKGKLIQNTAWMKNYLKYLKYFYFGGETFVSHPFTTSSTVGHCAVQFCIPFPCIGEQEWWTLLESMHCELLWNSQSTAGHQSTSPSSSSSFLYCHSYSPLLYPSPYQYTCIFPTASHLRGRGKYKSNQYIWFFSFLLLYYVVRTMGTVYLNLQIHM